MSFCLLCTQWSSVRSLLRRAHEAGDRGGLLTEQARAMVPDLIEQAEEWSLDGAVRADLASTAP
ncbi:hypothetical protein [Rubrivirga marina]|nr:hypothetical protein [Rubrivirga marina]